MLKSYLEIGKIVGTHALKGEVRVDPWCDSPAFMKKFKTLYFDSQGKCAVAVTSCRPHGNVCIVKLEGIDTPEQGQQMRNKVLYIKRSDAVLSKEQYFISELIGCRVYDSENPEKDYGKITDVSQTGANDVWYIQDEMGKEYLIPAIPLVVKKVEVFENRVYISPLKGIFDGEVNGDAD